MPHSQLIDRFDRTINYLRVSVTDRCNFRCVYCMPEEGVPCAPKSDLLTFDELSRVIRIAAELGMSKIRFTGGEPLLRKDLEGLILCASASGFTDIGITTNGFGLDLRAALLRAAGLNRINISLDTLNPATFRSIARRGDLDTVLRGIESSLAADLHPVKLNVVTMRGINSEEVPDFAAWTLRAPVHVRFIELMPIRWNEDKNGAFDMFAPHGGKGLLQLQTVKGGMLDSLEMRKRFVSSEESKRLIESSHGQLQESSITTNGPARTFRLPHSLGTIGFISQISNDLCIHCNRLRLTADGFLRPCLMSDGEIDLKPSMRETNSDQALKSVFDQVVAQKPERHYLAEGQQVKGRNMSQIGG